MSAAALTADENDDCELCDGKGEISAGDLDKHGEQPCPSCISRETAALRTERDKYGAALEHIVAIEAGSRGAYSKFADAQSRAREALGMQRD